MLVQVALIVFALSAVLSLIIDVGYARLTQGQMQNAADSAALEGLRNRDVSNNAFQNDCFRRAAANRVVHWTFDDNLDATDGDPDYQFGAGPIIDLTDGVTSLHALQTASVPDAHSYKPDLQMNQQNQVYGDMVSGRFCYTSDPVRSEDAGYEVQDLVCTEPQRGSGSYARNDFNPNTTPPPPSAFLSECPAPDDAVSPPPSLLPAAGALGGADNSAFLVRLRRSNDFQDLGGQTELGVGSSGPSLPLTFGKATTIHGDDPTAAYSVRRDGLTVRATAIAEVRRALHVGRPQPQSIPPLPGVTSFALTETFVATLSGNGSPVTINPVNGVICRGAIPVAMCTVGALTVVGRSVNDPMAISTVGRCLSGCPPGELAPPSIGPFACANIAGYGPVYSQMISAPGRNRIIGFARIGLSQDATTPARAANPCAKLISRGASLVAASNATAVLAAGLPLPAGTQPAEITELLNRHATGNYAPVLVPVLAR